MSGVSQNNNTTPSHINGHNGHSLRDMFPETFTLLDLIQMRSNHFTINASMKAVLDLSRPLEENWGWVEADDDEDAQSKSIGHGKNHQQKRVVMPRTQLYQRTTLKYAREYKFACEQIVGVTGEHCLLRYSGACMSHDDPLPKKETSDWRFKKANRDGIVARSSEWKRHEVRRDRQLKSELNAWDAHDKLENHLRLTDLLIEAYEANMCAIYGGEEPPTEFERQYAEEIALELRLEELAELNNWDVLKDDSYFTYDDYEEDELLYDFHYSAEANAAWEEYQNQITPWLRKLPRIKTEEQQEAEYEAWFLKRNRVPAEVEVVDDSPPVPPTGHRKSLAEKKLPVLRQQLFLRYESGLRQLIKKSSVGGVSKLEFKKHVNPPDEEKVRRAEASERKREEIRKGRKMKQAEM